MSLLFPADLFTNIMTTNIKITQDDIINEVKFSGQLPTIISQIIDRKIIAAAISKLKIAATDQELQDTADQFRLLNNLATAQATMEWLQTNSLSVTDLEKIAESTVNTHKLAEKLFSKADVEQYFFEHKLDFVGVVMYEIMLENKDLAMEIFYEIQEQETTFHAAAHQHIADPELRRSGGYSGIRRRADLLPEISAAVFASTAPQLLKPITTNRGIHLIYVEQIINPQLSDLFGEIMGLLFQQWLQGYKQEIDIIRSF